MNELDRNEVETELPGHSEITGTKQPKETDWFTFKYGITLYFVVEAAKSFSYFNVKAIE